MMAMSYNTTMSMVTAQWATKSEMMLMAQRATTMTPTTMATTTTMTETAIARLGIQQKIAQAQQIQSIILQNHESM